MGYSQNWEIAGEDDIVKEMTEWSTYPSAILPWLIHAEVVLRCRLIVAAVRSGRRYVIADRPGDLF